MGFYRLLLAVLVLLSHADVTVYGYNPGVVAVISFFLLSGFVMSELIGRHYRRAAAVPLFYLDRALRLFPQFLLYSLLTWLALRYAAIRSPFLDQLTPFKWLLNLLMLPQGFYMYWADGALVIPQSWSLGLELSFYLAIPWIVLYAPGRRLHGVMLASLLVYLAAYLGLLNSDHFGYRLLPGTLFMFLCGTLYARRDAPSRRLLALLFALAAALWLAALANARLHALPFNKEVLLGLLTALLVVGYCRDLALPPRLARWDLLCGNLSYGVFLNHFLLIWCLQRYLGRPALGGPALPALVALSLALAALSFALVERPALAWRRRLRRAAAPAPAPAPPPRPAPPLRAGAGG